jgi:hypothetical protein
MKYMQTIRITGLCLVAMFAVSLVASATASANWEQCLTEKTGEPPTKYKDAKCLEASSTGSYEWKVVGGTEKVEGGATLELKDTKVPILGEATVICTGTEVGSIGPSQFDRVETVKNISCTPVKVCETPASAVALHTPWQTVLFETEGKKRDKITATNNGQPGWAVTCKTPLGTKTDTCETETGKEGTPLAENKQAAGNVQIKFDKSAGKAKCTEGGAESGEISGTVQVAAAGYAIRVQ